MRLVRLDAFLAHVTMPQFHRHSIVALDIGTKRVGVARTDESKQLVFPVGSIERTSSSVVASRMDAESVAHFAKKLYRYLTSQRASGVVVGYPVPPEDGRRSPMCAEVEAIVSALHAASPSELGDVPCTFWDESFSTSEARRRLRSLKRSGARASEVANRDALAAASILEGFVSSEAAAIYGLQRDPLE